MPHEVPLPPPWRCLEGKVHYVQQVSATEFCSTCPVCHGEVHANGEWPDRCRLFVDSHPTLFCRRCGLISFPDKLGAKPPDPIALEQWRRDQQQRELARRRSAERALEHLRRSAFWKRYHERMPAHGRMHWRKRGIPDSFIDYWQFGWDSEHIFHMNGNAWHTATATIPLFDPEWQVGNVKHRLQNVPADGGKYRYELAGQGQPLFLADPDLPIADQVTMVEGEIKSAVVKVTLDDGKACVVGLPGASPSKKLLTPYRECGRITLVMDPGARIQAWELCKYLGRKRCRVLLPPVSIDDGIIASGMSGNELRRMLAHAIPAG